MRTGTGWRGVAAVFAVGVAFACSGGGSAGQAPATETVLTAPVSQSPGPDDLRDAQGNVVPAEPVNRPAPDIHQAGQVIAGAETWAPHEDMTPCPGCAPVPSRVGPPGLKDTDTKTIACLIDGAWRGCGAVSPGHSIARQSPRPDGMRDAPGLTPRCIEGVCDTIDYGGAETAETPKVGERVHCPTCPGGYATVLSHSGASLIP
jgi:hypothetical protein